MASCGAEPGRPLAWGGGAEHIKHTFRAMARMLYFGMVHSAHGTVQDYTILYDTVPHDLMQWGGVHYDI